MQDPQPVHPMQPIIKVDSVMRFRANAIVRALLDRSGLGPDGLMTFDPSASPEDRAQIVQLLGCLVDDPHVRVQIWLREQILVWPKPEPVLLKKGYQPHPMQPVVEDGRGVLRFQANAIVRSLLDRDDERGRVYPDFPARSDGGLNWVAMQDFSQEDQEQFAQLIGYSISGYHELSYVSDESAAEASARARAIAPDAGGCRDAGCPFHGGPLRPASPRTRTANHATTKAPARSRRRSPRKQ